MLPASNANAHAHYSCLPAEQGLARHKALIALLLVVELTDVDDDVVDDDDDTMPTTFPSFKFVRHEK